jgi:hypothetical protein
MATENMIKFLRGNVASLPATATAGAVYFTKDEGLYLGLEDGTYHRYGDFITVADVASLPESGAHETCMYYCESENILAKWDGSAWVQINKQKTLAELGGVAKSVYEAKIAALEKADTDNATAIGNLSTYVGTIPETATATNIVAYVQEKTSGIATDTALEELTGRVATAEGDIDKLEAAIAEGGSVANAIAEAKKAGTDAQATADSKTTMAEVEAKGYQNAEQVQAIVNGKDAAIQAAQDRADSAYTLAEGKATMEQVNAAIAGAGHAVKTEVDTAIENLGKAYVAADEALETKLQGNIDKKVDQTAYDTKVGELVAEDARLAGLISDMDTAYKAADTALDGRVATLEGTITGLSGAMHFKGVKTEIPEDVTGYVDGDVIIVGEKEYVFNGGAFVEFGDVSAEGDRIAALEGVVGKAAEGENDATGLVKAVADNAAAIAAEKARAEGKEAELAAADATNLQSAKDYADAAVEALGIGDYIKKADADAAYAVIGHNHDDKYDAIGAAAGALTEAKGYADQAELDAVATAKAYTDELANGQVKANTEAIATKAAQTDLDNAVTRIGTAEGKITALETASATHALKTDVEGVQTALDTYKTENNSAVALKANAADVYTKEETYKKDEVYAKAEVEAMLTWGSF